MLRARLRAQDTIRYTNVDVVKDAAMAMLEAAGCPASLLIGESAQHWGAAPICLGKSDRHASGRPPLRRAREIVISTTSRQIAPFLAKCRPEAMVKTQAVTEEHIDLAGATITADLAPVFPGTTFINAFTLTPILVSRDGRSVERIDRGRWHSDVRDVDISAKINARLTKIAGRTVGLTLVPDAFYLSSHPNHAVRVDVKSDGKKSGIYVGMSFPFTLFGTEDDLRLAWYAGIGERNRYGFGFFGLAA